MLDVKVDTRELDRLVRRTLPEFEKQIPYALSRALLSTAQDLKTSLVGEMQSNLNSPTRWVLNSLRIDAPDKKAVAGGKAVALVYAGEDGKGGVPPAEILAKHLKGGARGKKKFEQRDGYLVPASGAPLDKHGNVTRAQFKRWDGKLFRKGNTIYERRGRLIKPVMVVTSAPEYQPVLDWQARADEVVAQRFNGHFATHFEKAVATAKRR